MTALRSPAVVRLPAHVVAPLIAFLTLIRFAASSVSAYLGIEGVDTRTLDAAFEVYTGLVVVVVLVATSVILREAIPGLGLDRRGWMLAFLASLAAVEWVGVANPGLRLLSGPLAPYADFLLGVTVVLGLVLLTGTLASKLPRYTHGPRSRDALAALGYGFSAALLLRSIRLLDVTYLFGWPFPSGVLWVLDFGPVLLLAALSVVFWARLSLRRGGAHPLALALPVAGGVVGALASLGSIGGFVAANALAWGGSYTVFSPTWASLAIVGVAVGAFLEMARTLRGSLAPGPWALVVSSVAVAAFSGIQTSAGIVVSAAGLAFSVVCAHGALAELSTPVGGEGPSAASAYRE